MKLEIGKFYVKDIIFGDKTFYLDGILTINKEEALDLVKEDEHILEADLYIAKPGDNIRIVPIKDAVEPRVRLDGGPIFPGVTGRLMQVGNGRTLALKNCSVLSVGKHWGAYQDGLLDMSGEGAKHSYFSQLKNIVLVASTDEDFEKEEPRKKDKALRWAAFRLAEYIGKSVKELEPEEIETYELEAISKRSANVGKLPSVVFVPQITAQMDGEIYNELVYGWGANKMLPTYMHPNEILDGAIVGNSFMPSSSKWSTYDFQNYTMIKRLYEEHGKTINFLGVVLSTLGISLEEKERAAQFVAQNSKSLGADSAVVAVQAYGNPDVDFISCIVALEDAGIKTVGLTNECTGRDGTSQPLMTLDPKADAIVSCGEVSQLVELEAMETVLGELKSLGRDGFAGGWEVDEKLGPSVREDGSIIMENNSLFCSDGVVGRSSKIIKEY